MQVITQNAIKIDPKKDIIPADTKVNLPKEIALKLIEQGAVTEFKKYDDAPIEVDAVEPPDYNIVVD